MPRRALSARALAPAFAAALLLLTCIAEATFVQPPPLSLTAANKTFPFQLRSWLPPNKNTTLSALGRAAGSLAAVAASGGTNKNDLVNATAAAARGLALYKSETSALLGGLSGIVSYAPATSASPTTPASDLICYVDKVTGMLVGLQQSSSLACSATDGAVVVPTSSGGYISQIKLAYSYDGAFVARLVFYLRANAAAKPMAYTCGSAGGKAVDLLPDAERFVVTKVSAGCAPLPAVNGGGGGGTSNGRRLRRSLLQSINNLLGLSAATFGVIAAPLASFPIDPITGLPLVPPGMGEVLAPEEPLPTPVPTTTPLPPPMPPVVVNANAANLLEYDAPTLVITGQNFDGSTPSNNVVALNLNLTATVLSSTSTTLSVQLLPVANQPDSNSSNVVPKATQRPRTGPLTAVVSVPSRGTTSGPTPVQVGTLLLPRDNWRTAAATSDGNTLFLGVNRNGTIWKSTDGGVSFSVLPNAPLSSWQALSVSATGDVIVGGTSAGDLWISNDGGNSFNSAVGVPPAPNEWNAAAVSADGSTIVAGITSSGALWRSYNGGVFSIVPSAPTTVWRSIAISSNGQHAVAGVNGGNLWQSSDGGVCFAAQGGGAPPNAHYRAVATSANGTAIAAVVSGGAIWLSSDAGGTYAASTGAPTAMGWNGITMSADGRRLAACANPGSIYTSNDYGATFTATSAPTTMDWYSLAASSDGEKIIAGTFYNHVWISYDGGATWSVR